MNILSSLQGLINLIIIERKKKLCIALVIEKNDFTAWNNVG